MYEEHVPERVLEPEECAALARSVAALMPTPAPADEGSFTLLWRTTHSEGWLNVWPEAREAGFHDHDGSSVGVHVIEGTASNDGISLDGNPTVRRFAAGDSFSLGPDRIHRMIHDAGSTTVHVYSPPLRAIGDYAVVGGELRRVTHAPDEMSPPSRGF
jgi:hypothetical protein